MIEHKFVAEKIREVEVRTFVKAKIGEQYCSKFEIKRTPLGEKIVIHTSKPGLIVGKKGENIKLLTEELKKKFKMENPQIEIVEIANPEIDAQTIADQIKAVMERFGPKRFKSTGYKTLQKVIDAGAIGTEIILSGRGLPSSRAKSWRFYAGYVKKSGDIAYSQVAHAQAKANLRSGTIGIKVAIMLPSVKMPDKIELRKQEVAKEGAQIQQIEIKAEEGAAQQQPSPLSEEKPKTRKGAVKKKEGQAKEKKKESKENTTPKIEKLPEEK
ncbi:30S ribosomal protein S3 [archaeon]|nr:30S ribosomal protein S3 [archaeon]